MLVVDLDRDDHNYVMVGDEPFFLFETASDKAVICPDRCPHRGGPLHLGTRDCGTHALTCPWHHMVFMEGALVRRGVPSVSTGSRISAVFPVDPETPVYLQKRRIIANEQ